MIQRCVKLTRLSEDDLYIKYEEITFLEKEKIFDRCKNLKLKVYDAVILTCFRFLLQRQLRGVSTKETQSVVLINGHKSSKSRRTTIRSPCHHIPICYCLVT